MTAKKQRTNSDGYCAVLDHFGKRHGAKTQLARALGKTRQVVDRWERYGIPLKYLPELTKLTGLKPQDIWPELFQ